MKVQTWLELALSLLSCCGLAGPSSHAAGSPLIHRSPNMWTLIGLGTGAAFLYSLWPPGTGRVPGFVRLHGACGCLL
jgi:Cu+-exporting ATPase